MALRASRPDRRAARGRKSAQERALVAAAEKVTDRIEKNNGAGVQLGAPWQRDYWRLHDLVPEMRAAGEITGQAMGQCRLVIARPSTTGGAPAPLELKLKEDGTPANPEDYNHPAVAWLRKFAGGVDGQSEMLEKAGQLYTGSGEGVFVGALDPDVALRNRDPFQVMHLYSEQQVHIQPGGKIIVRQDESAQSDREVIEGDANGMTAVRTWRPDPKLDWRANSAGKAALPVLREICILDSHIRASGTSRLTSNGLMKVPTGVQLPGKAEDDADPDTDIDPFMRLLMEIASMAIADPDSAAAMIPILIRGEREDLAAMEHMSLSTPFDEKVADLREKAIGRLGTTVDMPGEILTGYGALQHWTGALITEEWKGSYLPKFMRTFCSSVTTGLLYPYMVKLDSTAEADVIVWFDDSDVRTRENVGPEAMGAYDRGEIDGEALRRRLTFDDSDVASGPELGKQLAKMLILKAPALAPILFPMLDIEFTDDQLAKAAVLKDLIGNVGAPPGGSGDLGGVPAEGGTQQIPDSSAKPGGAGGFTLNDVDILEKLANQGR